jgi:mRNA-degrading endonuclease RelE of RelBE toxin-antitoxin system
MKAVFIESAIFAKYRAELLDDDSYREFQAYLMDNPTAGDPIQGTGGLRKIRWSSNGKGKRGGVMVIYYYFNELSRIYLATLYQKGDVNDLTKHEYHVIGQIMESWINEQKKLV